MLESSFSTPEHKDGAASPSQFSRPDCRHYGEVELILQTKVWDAEGAIGRGNLVNVIGY